MIFCNSKQKLLKLLLVSLLFLLSFPVVLGADFEFEGMMFVGWYHKSYQNLWGWNCDFGYAAKTYSNYGYNYATKVCTNPTRPGGWTKSIDALLGIQADKNHPTKLNYIGVEVSWGQNAATDNDMYRMESLGGDNEYKTAPNQFTDDPNWDDYAGPAGSGLTAVIDYIHSKGINIMLYPMVRIGWGQDWADLTPTTPATWFNNYTNKILVPYAQLLVNHYRPGDIFCIGQELQTLQQSANLVYWQNAISAVRTVFSNAGLDVPLVYGGNWDTYNDAVKKPCFWNLLDYAGISAYFPLKNAPSPSLAEIKAAWTGGCDVPGYVGRNWVSEIINFHNTTNNVDGVPIPVIFTEIGYASKKDAAKRPNEGAWSGQTGGKGNNQGSTNQDAYGSGDPYGTSYSYWGGAGGDQNSGQYEGDLQANCYEAAMEVFMPYADGISGNWFKGFFWWHWQTWREGGNWRNAYIPTGGWIPGSDPGTNYLYNITYSPQYKLAHLKKGTDGGKYTLGIGYNDTPTPELINPPALLVLPKDVPYNFQFKAGDKDGDRIRYYVNWGDGTTNGPTAFGNPEWVWSISHSFSTIGLTTVTFRATDESGNGPNYTGGPYGDGSTTWNPNDSKEIKIILDIKDLPRVTNQELFHQVSDVTPGWPPLTWQLLNVAVDRSICNDEEVKLKATLSNLMPTDTVDWIRYYYEAGSSTQTVTTYYDVGNDTGTSYYIQVSTTPVEVVGTDRKYEAVFPVDINNARSYINIQVCAKAQTMAIGTMYVNSSENYYVVNSTGTAGTGEATSGNRKYYVLTGRGTMNQPYPLQWNVVDTSFTTALQPNYSPLRHGNREPSTSPATLQVGSTTYYYFMPGGIRPNNPLYDLGKLQSDHFTSRPGGTGVDGYGDLFINETPYIYLRASNTDLSPNSSLEYTANNNPGPWSVANSVSLSTFTALNLGVEKKIAPSTGTDAQNKKGYALNYYYLQPVNYSLMMSNLPEGTTVYYYYKVRDMDPAIHIPALPDTQFWKKKLCPLGVKLDTDVISNFYSFEILQDDYTPPYIHTSAGQTHSMRPRSPAIEHLLDWISGYYSITAQISDTANGANSFDQPVGPWWFATYSSNFIGNNRGDSSGVYVNPANPASGTSTPYSPVHDTRCYYIITSTSPATMATIMGGAYNATDQYFTGGSFIQPIDDNAPTKTTSSYWGKTWDFQDNDKDGFGYVPMTNTGGSTWIANIPLREEYIIGPGRYLYYRIYTCNNDSDPQAYITPSDNHLRSVDGDPFFGYGDTTGAYNNHGTPGNAWNNPFDAATARESDRDHAWAMWTRCAGGGPLPPGPPRIKITSEVTIGGTKRKVITYIDSATGKVLSTQIK